MRGPFRFVLAALAGAVMAAILLLPQDAFAEAMDVSSLDTECVATALKSCKVLSAGWLNVDWGEDEGTPMLAWQTQAGFTDADGVLGGFVLLHQDEGNWFVLDSGFDGARFEPPRLGMDNTILHIAGYTAGTGAYNADRLYVFGDTGAAAYRERWNRVDIETWRDSIDMLLPEGLEIWKGVDYDFSDWFYGELTAATPLWRSDDGNCCPSGGSAVIHFVIDDTYKLVATRADLLPQVED